MLFYLSKVLKLLPVTYLQRKTLLNDRKTHTIHVSGKRFIMTSPR
jgi:hypothetical protein